MNTLSSLPVTRLVSAVLVTLMAMMSFGNPVALAEEGQPIQVWGVVYLDANGDGRKDDEEAPVPGTVVNAAAGDLSLSAESDETGTFRLELLQAVWELSLQLPDGIDVESVEPVILDYTAAVDIEQQVDFPLRLEVPEIEEQDPEDGATLDPADQHDDPVSDPQEQADTEGNDAADQLPEILPESGANLHPATVAGALTVAFLLVGAGLIVYGRNLEGRK